jgi:hypothetical protein
VVGAGSTLCSTLSIAGGVKLFSIIHVIAGSAPARAAIVIYRIATSLSFLHSSAIAPLNIKSSVDRKFWVVSRSAALHSPSFDKRSISLTISTFGEVQLTQKAMTANVEMDFIDLRIASTF